MRRSWGNARMRPQFGEEIRVKRARRNAQPTHSHHVAHPALVLRIFGVIGGIASPPARLYQYSSAEPHRSLAVVPLIPDKRYYGEAPVRPAGRSGAGLEEYRPRGSAFWGVKLGPERSPRRGKRSKGEPLPGCRAHARARGDALLRFQEPAKAHPQALLESGLPIPVAFRDRLILAA
jgi:hypothetical protein